MEAKVSLSTMVKPDFPILEQKIDGNDLIYLDTAATALKPQSVISAVSSYYTNFTANIHRGRHMLSEKASDKYELARNKVAMFVGCASNEVIFTRNTTEALNLASNIIDLKPEDIVVGFLDSHHSQILPWMRRGNYQAVTHDANWLPDLDHYRDLLAQNPKVVVMSHCSNVTGSYIPLQIMVDMAKEIGALVVVDAAQSLAHCRINFAELNADFVAFSSHKLMGPSGVGCLIAKAELLRDADPVLDGGGTVDFVTLDGFDYRKIPHKFEAGTPAIEASYGLAAAIDYINGIGFDNIEAHEMVLNQAFFEAFEQSERMYLLGSQFSENRAPIFSIYVDGIENLKDVTRSLSDSFGIMCRNGHLCCQPLIDAHTDGEVIRLSAYIYNSAEEIKTAVAALNSVIASF